MIYLVTQQQELFQSNDYKVISIKDSLAMLNGWEVIQFDTETSGRDAHINRLLCIQFGNDNADAQIVVDINTISISHYKTILEEKFLILQNAKFDLQFLYSCNIIPRRVYDTMIVEQLLYLGFPHISVNPEEYTKYNYDFPYLAEVTKEGNIMYSLSFSLKAIANKRLGIDIDKTVRGEIIWRGLDTAVIKYAAGDVMYLQKIMQSQLEDCKKKNCLKGAQLECNAIPSLAYFEWCGIKLDEIKWKIKMKGDLRCLEESKKALDTFVLNTPVLRKYTYVERQGDLFTGFCLEPQVNINWSSSKQVIEVAKLLGFNTSTIDKNTGEEKDTVLEKELSNQKGINDEFLKLYFDYQGYNKVVTSFGQGHLDAINPITGRIHTVFKQLGAASGRMSCGSQQSNTDLASYKGIQSSNCKYPNLQQLPSDHATRASFVAEEGNMFCSCDFSAEESRLGADIYQDKEFLKEFTEGSKDTHNMFAWIVYNDECRALGCKDATEVKEKAPKQRKKVKGFEFGYMFGAAAPTLAKTAGCSVEEAQNVINILDKAFYGMANYAKRGSKFVRENGYIIINPITGHKMYWWDYAKWKNTQKSFTKEFWDNYKLYHKGTGDLAAQQVRRHSQAASKYDRLARNACTQGTGAIILKDACTDLFNWIVNNGYFGKILMCVPVHDELNCEYPKECSDFPDVLKGIMENSASKYCKSLPIPAVPEVSTYWVH